MTLGPIAFLAPWLLAALALLPVLWWLLRAVPPSPARQAFPGVRLLLGLDDPERIPERTPWWLMLLRMLAVAAAILAFSVPVLNPRQGVATGPLVVLLDGGWGDAPDWTERTSRIAAALDDAARAGRPVAVLAMTAAPPEGGPGFRAAQDWTGRLAAVTPRPWAPDRAAWAGWAEGLDEGFETLWLTDGLGHDGAEDRLARALLARGPVTLVRPAEAPIALTPPRLEGGALAVTAVRPEGAGERPVAVTAIGPDPSGVERPLGAAEAVFAEGETEAVLALDLPAELRNRVGRVVLAGDRSAAGVALADDSVRRRKVGLMSGRAGDEAQELIDPLHYLRNAFAPFAEVIEAPLPDMLRAAPDVLVLADVGSLGEAEHAQLVDWVEKGGLLLRFAGPRLAASGAGQLEADPLLPVRLRAGGRSLGGAMSWGAPRRLQPFPEGSPFAGLDLPDDVDISAQVMAQPDPNLPDRVMASLEDGTPLVTGVTLGDGRVVLVHVTANADWSNLPLSGLFVRMLERLTLSAGGGPLEAEALAGAIWQPLQVMNGFGDLGTPSMVAGVPGERLGSEPPAEDMPPGIYASGERRAALNVLRAGDTLAPMAQLPGGVTVEALDRAQEVRLGPWLLAVALGLLALDVLATLAIGGRLAPRRGGRAAAALALALAGAALAPQGARAQESDAEIMAAVNETVLAYVQTGNARVDAASLAGMRGLSQALNARTAIEPGEPVAVDLERDDLAIFPFLYWPVTEGQRTPSDAAYAKLNDFMRHGGMILFDTQDAQLGGGSMGSTPNGRVLQRIALRLDVPPLEPAPADHVLTRTFYLLQDFPGRYTGEPVWVEAATQVEEVEGMPFRNLNDGVTPVVIGANDWAAAWAVNENGDPAYPIGRGIGGERQREIALRFGVNLIMYVMTGNYKSDQVHVPALLDRLGQ